MTRRKKWMVEKAKNGEFYFKLIASNGQVLLTSETYSSKSKLEETLDTLKGKRMPMKIVEIDD